MRTPEIPIIYIKDKSGKTYKRLGNGMILRANSDDIKKLAVNSITPTPYTNIISGTQLPDGNSNSDVGK